MVRAAQMLQTFARRYTKDARCCSEAAGLRSPVPGAGCYTWHGSARHGARDTGQAFILSPSVRLHSVSNLRASESDSESWTATSSAQRASATVPSQLAYSTP